MTDTSLSPDSVTAPDSLLPSLNGLSLGCIGQFREQHDDLTVYESVNLGWSNWATVPHACSGTCRKSDCLNRRLREFSAR